MTMATSKIEKNVKGLRTLSKSGTLSSNSSTTLTADIPTGCEFLCWVQASSDGWIGLVYPTNPLSQTSIFWGAQPNKNFNAFYLVEYVGG